MAGFVLRFLTIFATFVLAGAIQKPAFLMILSAAAPVPVTAGDYLDVIVHGLPMDCTVAGYLTVIPAILMMISVWKPGLRVLRIIETAYYAVASALVALTAAANIGLYSHWGFPLDTTPLFYLTTSPGAAAASATPLEIAAGIGGTIILGVGLFLLLWQGVMRIPDVAPRRRRPAVTAVLAVLTAALFIPIRGGFTVSTMNISRSYYTNNNFLNHAAVNPTFSLLYSATHRADYAERFRFTDEDTAAATVAGMYGKRSGKPAQELLSEQRPDIYLVILESFSSALLPSQGGEAVAVRLDSIARSGILFDNFYASSFRTDRALPAILGAIPGQPTASLMKFVSKTEGLPSLPASLKKAGWTPSYYYGGDINFTNMQAYLMNCGFGHIVCDSDFPLSERTGKWGAHDHNVFARVLDEAREASGTPAFRVIQTSSSHEPFEVPYSGSHADPAANAFAYTDSCLAQFVDAICTLPRKSLIIIIPDHYGCYPRLEGETARHHVPMVWTGNALGRRGIRVSGIGSQTDLAATLLAQLGQDGSAFRFSRDMTDSNGGFAFYSSPNAFVLTDADGTATIDVATDHATGPKTTATRARAYLQNLYNYLDSL